MERLQTRYVNVRAKTDLIT